MMKHLGGAPVAATSTTAERPQGIVEDEQRVVARTYDGARDLVRRAAAVPRYDPFRAVNERTHAHRREHGCWAYAYGDGATLVAIASIVGAGRVLELGTALGYSALCLATSGSTVDTIERDDIHVALARLEVQRAGAGARVHVHQGDFAAVLPTLAPRFDLAFFDGFAATEAIYEAVAARLATGGVLVSANLDHGSGEAYLARILDAREWDSHFIDSRHETAVSVRR